jgi:hypothetical protein
MSNFKKIAAGAAAVLVLAAGAFGAAQSTNVDDAKANGLRVSLRANGL